MLRSGQQTTDLRMQILWQDKIWRLHGGNLILHAFDHNRTAAGWARLSHVCYRMTGQKPKTLAEPVAHNSSDTCATPPEDAVEGSLFDTP